MSPSVFAFVRNSMIVAASIMLAGCGNGGGGSSVSAPLSPKAVITDATTINELQDVGPYVMKILGGASAMTQGLAGTPAGQLYNCKFTAADGTVINSGTVTVGMAFTNFITTTYTFDKCKQGSETATADNFQYMDGKLIMIAGLSDLNGDGIPESLTQNDVSIPSTLGYKIKNSAKAKATFDEEITVTGGVASMKQVFSSFNVLSKLNSSSTLDFFSYKFTGTTISTDDDFEITQVNGGGTQNDSYTRDAANRATVFVHQYTLKADSFVKKDNVTAKQTNLTITNWSSVKTITSLKNYAGNSDTVGWDASRTTDYTIYLSNANGYDKGVLTSANLTGFHWVAEEVDNPAVNGGKNGVGYDASVSYSGSVNKGYGWMNISTPKKVFLTSNASNPTDGWIDVMLASDSLAANILSGGQAVIYKNGAKQETVTNSSDIIRQIVPPTVQLQ